MLFSGCATALVTPFTSDEKIDFPALEALIARQLSAGIDALVSLGTTGEPTSLSDREKDAALSFTLEKVNGRVPVIAGCGCADTRSALRQARRCARLGADALLAVTPYYLKTTQEGLLRHFLALADAAERPVILYNVPGRTGVNLLPDTAAHLSRHPNIQGLKEASGDLVQLAEIVRLAGSGLAVYSGNDDTALAAMALGARGVISVASNLEPERMLRLAHSALAGDFSAARAAQMDLLPLIRALFAQPSPIPVKAALALRGEMQDVLRSPLAPLPRDSRAALSALLAELS